MRLAAVGLITSAYTGDGKDAGYLRFTDVVGGAALSFRAPAADIHRLKPFVNQTVELNAEFTVNSFTTKENGTQLSLELLSVLDVKPVKLSIQPAAAAPAQKVG